jgi:glyoxylate carboligase
VILMIGSSNPSMMALPPASNVLASPPTSTAPGCHGRQHIIDHQRRHARPPNVAELLALGEVVPADVDGVGVRVIAEGDGNDMGHAVLPNCGQPPEPLAPEVVDLALMASSCWPVILTVIPLRTTNRTRGDQLDNVSNLTCVDDIGRDATDG